MNDKLNPDESDLLSTEAILEYAWKSFQIKLESFDKLDSKAATLAGFIGIIIALSVGLLKTDIFYPTKENMEFIILSISIRCFYLLVVMTLSVSFGYCLATLKVRKVLEPTSIEDMIKHYCSLGDINRRKRQLLKDMIKAIRNAENDFRKNNISKSMCLEKATNWLIYSLCIGLLGYLWYQIYTYWTI
jgi:hypothetical protein